MKKKCLKLCLTFFAVSMLSIPSIIYLNAEEEMEEEETGPRESSHQLAEGYTRYEAEDATINECCTKGRMEYSPVDYGTYSGMGFVGEIDQPTSYVEYSITVSEDGSYPFEVCYAVDPSFGTATFNVFVNGAYFTTFSMKEKHGWGAFEDTPIYKSLINLNAGENTVRFAKGLNYSEMDFIDIGPRHGGFINPMADVDSSIKEVPQGYTRYEAEDGKVTSGKIYNTGMFSGTGYVGDLDYSGVSKIEFTVNAIEEGEYSLRVAYAIGDGFNPATIKINNNDGFYTTGICSKTFGWGSFDTDAIVETTISLHEGKNTITVFKASEFAQIDFIDVSNAKIGEFKENAIVVKTPYLQDGYTRYEAEKQFVIKGESKGIGYFNDMGTYSGYGFVGCLDNDNCYIEIPLTVEEDGEYEIKIGCAAYEKGASIKLYSGTYGRGGSAYFYKEETLRAAHGWGMFEEDCIISTSICLKKGLNYIIIRSGLVCAEVDYLDFGSKIGEFYEGTFDETLYRKNK